MPLRGENKGKSRCLLHVDDKGLERIPLSYSTSGQLTQTVLLKMREITANNYVKTDRFNLQNILSVRCFMYIRRGAYIPPILYYFMQFINIVTIKIWHVIHEIKLVLLLIIVFYFILFYRNKVLEITV